MTLAHDLKACYRELGLPCGSSLAEVKRAYHTLAKELHPDLNPGAQGILMSRVNKAYRILKRHLEQQQAYKAYVFQTFVPDSGSISKKTNYSTPYKQTKSKPSEDSFFDNFSAPALRRSVSLGPLQVLPDDDPSDKNRFWRLMGLNVSDGQLVYKTEIVGKIDFLSIPVRRVRACEYCQGKGFEDSVSAFSSCSHCGGKGRITCSETLEVQIPRKWQSGQRIQTKAKHQGMPIVVELSAPLAKEE